MKSVVVTGASGFIGRHCLSYLRDQEFKIHVISQFPDREIYGKDVSIHHADLFSAEQPVKKILQKIRPSHFLHLAWTTQPGVYWTSPENAVWAEMSIQLVRDFIEAGGDRFVFAGTCAEYSWGGECVENKSPEQPTSPYGLAKLSVTKFLENQSSENKLSAAVGRIFFLFGPGESESRLVPSVIKSILKGQTPSLTDGKQLRDFMYVEDVARALVSLLDSKVRGVVNIASGSPTTLRELIESIAQIMDYKGALGFGIKNRSADDPDKVTASVERLRNELKFVNKYSLREGLSHTIKSFKEAA